ncbi:hypothetical protein, partial [Cephaloticoccus primus]|uniref:hypothetical protein n=1 Tax=Cephaloticoccus primus TaxID=1548207 RepID=UPI0012E95A70
MFALLWGALAVFIATTATAQVLLPARRDLVATSTRTVFPGAGAIVAPQSPPLRKRKRVLEQSAGDWLKYLDEPVLAGDGFADDLGIVLRDGGVLRLGTDLDIELGAGENQLRWEGSGGFAAYGRARRVRLSTADGAPIQWGGTAHFLGEYDELIFGARDADATLVWDSALNLGGLDRTVRVIRSEAGFGGATVRFDSSFSNGDLIFMGDGRVDLNAANTEPRYTVTTRGVELRLSGRGSLKTPWFLVGNGGSLILDNLGTYNPDRLRDDGHIHLESGTFAYWGGSGLSRETVGTVVLLRGANTIDVVNNSTTAFTRLIFSGIEQGLGATVNFTNSRRANGEFGTGATKTPQIKVTNTKPGARVTPVGGILPYATVNGSDFATLQKGFLVAYSGYHTGDPAGWNEKVNASPTGDHTLGRYTELNSLRLTGQRLTIHDSGLRLNANALLATGAKESRIDGGTLYTSSAVIDDHSFFVHVYGSGGLTISSSIQPHPKKGSDDINLVKTGDGILRFSGDQDNEFSPWAWHHVNQGTLILAKTGGALALGGIVEVVEKSVLRLEGSQQLAADTTLMLRGRPPGIRGANDVGGSSTLQFGKVAGRSGGISQTISDLYVLEHGIIEFDSGSSPDSPNTLYIEQSFGMEGELGSDELLLVRGWRQYSDRILIRRTAAINHADLSKIKFEGYESTRLVDYNAHYLELAGFGVVPEPAVYGALIGTFSLGFFAWRERR